MNHIKEIASRERANNYEKYGTDDEIEREYQDDLKRDILKRLTSELYGVKYLYGDGDYGVVVLRPGSEFVTSLDNLRKRLSYMDQLIRDNSAYKGFKLVKEHSTPKGVSFTYSIEAKGWHSDAGWVGTVVISTEGPKSAPWLSVDWSW